MATANQVLAVIENLAGEKEKTASGAVGSGNYISVNIPYGLQGYAYCGTTIHYAFDKAGSTLLSGCSNPAYVPTLKSYCKAKGWTVSAPQKGCIFAYKDAHVGMVYEASGTTMITLEGNSTVKATYSEAKNGTGTGFEGIGWKKRTYDSNYTFYLPAYDGTTGASATTSATTSTTTTTTTSTSGGSGVRSFQKWLGVTEDGEYGPVTKKAAVKAYQKAMNAKYNCGLEVDGVFGAKSRAAMTNARALASGSTGDLVYVLQGMLYCKGHDPNGLDGVFGSGTKAAVRAYQTANGMLVDGEAGPETFSGLLGA